jgi:hypothetical protein
VQVAYLGFTQQGNVRVFQFDASPNRQFEKPEFHVRLAMTVDMDIMRRYHLSWQDLPALCLRKLSELFERYEVYDGQGTEYAFTEADVCAYFASLPAPPPKKARPSFHGAKPALPSQVSGLENP